ncbi:MAG: GNAT family N-acetyltransferase, partial [Gammaproteobacteria bacterium]
EVHGIKSYARVRHLPFVPDLAIICTPPETVPKMVRKLGEHKVRACMILTGGLSRTHSRSGRPLMYSVRDIASQHRMRVLGPNTVGFMSAHKNINATYLHMGVLPGKISFIGQSGTLAGAVVDWALHREVGFSHLVTLGDGVDVDLDDLVDYLSQDRKTQALLLHVETIPNPRRFISAVRTVSRAKPVIAIKSGRTEASQWKPHKPPRGLTAVDPIYDAVLRRAGILRVNGMDEMFDALETLSRMKPVRRHSLAILSNGFGPGVLAVDRLASLEGELAELASETIEALAELLPPYWTRRNPIDLNYDAGPSTYAKAIQILEKDPNVSNVLVMFSPSLTEDSLQVADEVIKVARRSYMNIFTCWLGYATVQDARQAFWEAGIPTFFTPDKAIKAFMHLVNHQRGQELLKQTPKSYVNPWADRSVARKIVMGAYKDGRESLTNEEARQVLEVYGIRPLETVYCRTPEEVAEVAREKAHPVNIKIHYEALQEPFLGEDKAREQFKATIRRLSEPEAIIKACSHLRAEGDKHFPPESFVGYSVQDAMKEAGGIAFNIGVTRDACFGPLILCGAGGVRINVLADRQVALPPLNLALAEDAVSRSHMFRLLKNYSYQPEKDARALCEALVALSQLLVDLPVIRGVEVEPLLFDREGVVAVDMAIDLGPPVRPAIEPYPEELREWMMLPKSRRKAEIRPVRPEDEPAHIEFHSKLSPESIRYRFFHYRKHLSHDDLVRMLHIDYDREMAFIAVSDRGDGTEETLGVVRTWTDADNIQCEFAVIVRDDMRGENLGWALMRKMIDYCTERGTIEMIGTVLPDNKPMLKLAEKLGFEIRYDPEEEVMALRLPLNEPEGWQKERLAALHGEPVSE